MSHVRSIREKIEDNPSKPVYIQTDETLDANRALEKQNEIFKKYLSYF